MDYEKKYKEIVWQIKKAYLYAQTDSTKAVLEEIFPELKESEDERIRGAIIYFISHTPTVPKGIIDKETMIAWLEKQGEKKPEWTLMDEQRVENLLAIVEGHGYPGEVAWLNSLKDRVQPKQGQQKPIDKVEPKFKVGDWITNGDYTWKIVEIKPLDYVLQSQDGNIVDDTISHVDEQFHSFTIEDAKDGDVLFFDNDTIVIFKDLYNTTTFHSYCHIEDGVFDISKDDMPDWWEGKGFHPATKEQCDFLFQKMHEAGYEWDAEKKEPKKIIVPIFNIGDTIIKKHNSDIHDFGSFTITDITGGKYWYNDRIICDISEQDEWELYELVKQIWSEEDERLCSCLIEDQEEALDDVRNDKYGHSEIISDLKEMYRERINWLKSLKERIRG